MFLILFKNQSLGFPGPATTTTLILSKSNESMMYLHTHWSKDSIFFL